MSVLDTKTLEKESEILYNELVPEMGHCSTVQGEKIRAINQVIYRYLNDGDQYDRGYGYETVSPAMDYLLEDKSLASLIGCDLHTSDQQAYKNTIYTVLAHVIEFCKKHPEPIPNSFDSISCFERERNYTQLCYRDEYGDEQD